MCTTSALLAYKEIVWDLSSLFPFVFDFLVAFGILVPQPGMEPMSLQWKRRVLTIGLPGREFSPHFLFFLITVLGTSLVVQWLRIRLPVQGTRVRSLVREDPTCRGATKPTCCNY